VFFFGFAPAPNPEARYHQVTTPPKPSRTGKTKPAGPKPAAKKSAFSASKIPAKAKSTLERTPIRKPATPKKKPAASSPAPANTPANTPGAHAAPTTPATVSVTTEKTGSAPPKSSGIGLPDASSGKSNVATPSVPHIPETAQPASASAVVSIGVSPAPNDETRTAHLAWSVPEILFEGDAPPPCAQPKAEPPASTNPPATRQVVELLMAPDPTSEMTVEHRRQPADPPLDNAPARSESPAPQREPAPLPPLPIPTLVPAQAVQDRGDVWLAPRDSRSLLAYWRRPTDFASNSKRWIVRVWRHCVGNDWRTEIEAGSGEFGIVQVPSPGTTYVAELGFNTPVGEWIACAQGTPTATPGEEPSADRSVAWAAAKPLPDVLADFDEPRPFLNVPVNPESQPLVTPMECTAPSTTSVEPACFTDWSAGPGASELTNPARTGGGGPAPHAMDAVKLWADFQPETAAPSSSAWAGEKPASDRNFRFRVNAELVIYGDTEPGATLRAGSTTIPLRPDGSFSFRFVFPDGDYMLPLSAVAPDGMECRWVDLRLLRATLAGDGTGAAPFKTKAEPPGPEAALRAPEGV
jgi:hypothetical protein